MPVRERIAGLHRDRQSAFERLTGRFHDAFVSNSDPKWSRVGPVSRSTWRGRGPVPRDKPTAALVARMLVKSQVVV